MAKPIPNTRQGTAEAVKKQEDLTEIRRALSNAYAALQGDRNNQSFAAFTFEEALDAQIERIEGKGTQLRPNLLDRVGRIEQQVVQTVEETKQLPPEFFEEPREDEDVNTDPDQA